MTDKAAIHFECFALCQAFAYHLDHREFDALAGLFTPDGVFHRNDQVLAGQQAILAAYAQRPGATTQHVVTNFHALELTPTRVRACSYTLVVHAMGVSEQVLPFDPASAMRMLEFFDEFVLAPEGWRFALRRPRPVLQSTNWPGKP